LPDPQSPATFQRSQLNWDEPECQAHAELLDWHRRLSRLRRGRTDLTGGFEATHVDFGGGLARHVAQRHDYCLQPG
jgi:1,4-alpha-glucan branching enzyme